MDYIVEHLLGTKPWLYLDEIKRFLLEAYDVDVDLATVRRCLERIEITRKKIRAVAAQRNEELRYAWLWMIQPFLMDYYVAVDESGNHERTGDRIYGYSKRGIPAAVERFLQRRLRISLLAAYTTKGFIATTTFQGTCNADLFESFMIDILLPLCNQFPAERSMVVVDNTSIYHANKEAIETAYLRKGVFIKYLPPYSPDFNPIGESFNDLKGFIRRTYHQKKAQFDDYQGYLEWAVKEIGTGPAAGRHALKHFHNAGFRDLGDDLDC
ncbi:transposase protein [Rutstroemia sp. NJR-2017a BBW]|nr:transposase protein [Rutstroemia sp. NJR-2017a BBW]